MVFTGIGGPVIYPKRPGLSRIMDIIASFLPSRSQMDQKGAIGMARICMRNAVFQEQVRMPSFRGNC